MPLPASPFLRFLFGGSVVGSDRWACGLHVSLSGTFANPSGEMGGIADDARDFFLNDVWTGSTQKISDYNPAGVTFDTVSVWYYNAGLLVASGTVTDVPAHPGTSTNATSAGPYNAWVASLRSANTTRRGRGRMYLPATAGLTQNTTLQYASAACTGMATDVALFLSNMNSLYGTDNLQGICSVLSQGGKLPTPGAPDLYPITSVVVDSLPDTQRGRMNKFSPAAKATHAVTLP